MKAENEKELEDFFKEELKNFLNGRYDDAHERLSELRKKGKDATVLTFKIMTIPIKIKTFLATGDKQSFERLIQKIDEIKKEAELRIQKIKQ